VVKDGSSFQFAYVSTASPIDATAVPSGGRVLQLSDGLAVSECRFTIGYLSVWVDSGASFPLIFNDFGVLFSLLAVY
jgi:hypothetical protein